MFYKSYINWTICFINRIDMKKYLGEFEELVLTMVCILGEGAYGNVIVQEFENQLDRKVNLSSVHITLYRLEDKGLLTSHYGGATKTRGGRRKRYFSITNAGRNLLDKMKDDRMKLWHLMPTLKFS